MGGYLDESDSQPTRDQFVNNFIVLREQENLLTIAKQDRSKQDQRAFHESQVSNLKGILIRQITTGVWKEPKE